MKIYYNDNVLDVTVDDSSYRYRAIKGDHNLTLYFSLPEHVEIPVGAYCVYQNETYTLEKPESLKMRHSRYFEYTVVFDSPQAKAGKWKFRNPVDRRLKFSLTATPREHLQMFVDNMNQRDSGWTIGRCIDGPEKVIAYNHAYCIDALTQMADEFETEYEFVGKQVSLWKVEYNRDNPLPLSYGKGNGFKPGIGRSNYEDSTPIEILYVQGGAQNLDTSRYGSPELLLPKNETIRFDGVHFEDEDGFDASKARTYTTDTDGFSIRQADKPLSSQAEDSLDCSEIYPNWKHTVTKAIEVKEGVWDIYAENTAEYPNNSPSNLNYDDCRIGGETASVIFQTGELSGKEFDLVQTGNALTGYDYATKKFELVSQQIDGMNMPGGTFIPRIGDEFRLFGVRLPDTYICDDATKTGASWDMFREGVKYLYDNEEQKFSFTGELDGAWAKRDWNNIGGRIRLGSFVEFSDERFQPEGVLVRIIGIKDYINNPHSPEIELSNSTVGRSVASELRKIESNEVVVEDKHREALQFTKRRFRDSRETLEMLKEAMLDNFTESISPLSVQTMMMLIGDESLQFRFVNSMTDPLTVAHNVLYDTHTKVLSVPDGIIQHMTLGIDTISASHAASEYKFWSLAAFETPVLTDGEKKYYLYAKVSKLAKSGVFYISETAIGLEAVAGYYHLLMGVLNSEYEGERSYVSLYGFTEILPGRVTTDRIVSSDGKTYFDLAEGVISGSIAFKSGSSGLENISEWTQKQEQINSALTVARLAHLTANNLNYLKELLKNDETIVSGGVVVSSFLGVKNNQNQIVAGFSGKNFISGEDFKLYDNTCPMLFAGATGATEINNAKFRVYSSGEVAMKALIAEGGCKIGPYTVTDIKDSGKLFSAEYDTYNGNTLLTQTALTPTSIVIDQIYEDGLNAFGRIKFGYGFYDYKMADGKMPSLTIETKGRFHGGVLVNAKGASALEIPAGCIRGFRRYVRYVVSDTTLTNLDDCIVANNTAAIIISLPESPENGEEYEIFKNVGSGRITIDGLSNNITRFGVSVAPKHIIEAGQNYAIRLTYSSAINGWFMQFSNGKLT